jgi:hypothetical protein
MKICPVSGSKKDYLECNKFKVETYLGAGREIMESGLSFVSIRYINLISRCDRERLEE